MTFLDFFHATTGNKPYPYQSRLAGGDDGLPCASLLINIPTGLGKTAAVVLAWLWNRLILENEDWPRRLVYCLPMRTLVEQTRGETAAWIENLHEKGILKTKPHVVILMGGEAPEGESKNWDLHPERPAILIGTQDMLLSRALNRGYGMSRYRWPMHFALLNNDALWVMDEVQLMGSGLWTSAQLDWMRECRFSPQLPTKTWWMSATLGGDFLGTSDRRNEQQSPPNKFELSPEEAEALPILEARRPLLELKLKSPAKKSSKGQSTKKTGKAARNEESVSDQLAAHVLENHVGGSLSLIVCNRVALAQEVHRTVRSKSESKGISIELLTSRFRLGDRQQKLEAVLAFEKARKADRPHPGLILVSTQVVEAGFDVSATRLWTQLAPWPSIIQRLGRLNRDGKSNATAQAFVFEFPEDKRDPHASLPYEKADLKEARAIVSALVGLCAQETDRPIRQILRTLADGPLADKVKRALEPKPQPYPRALDVHGLFSTEADVFGGFTDVNPWVRNADASADVTVFWRDFEERGNAVNKGDGPGFQRDEGCSVAVHHLKTFLGANKHAYLWNSKAEQWETVRPGNIRPGMTLLLPAMAGGYDTEEGWSGRKGGNLGSVPPPGAFEQSIAHDPETEAREWWVPLDEHLRDTEKEATSIANALGFAKDGFFNRGLIRSAALHDIGKSLVSWQSALLRAHQTESGDRTNSLWAKSPRGTGTFRPGLRHEVASALAMWHRYYREGVKDDYPALAIYLVAAHHGKARTVLAARHTISEPNVCGIPIPPKKPPIAPLPWSPDWQMDFTAAEDGASGYFSEDGTEFIFESPGWTGLVADLLGGWEKDASVRTCGAVPENEPAALGPFALAYFETLLRAADGRASSNQPQTSQP